MSRLKSKPNQAHEQQSHDYCSEACDHSWLSIYSHHLIYRRPIYIRISKAINSYPAVKIVYKHVKIRTFSTQDTLKLNLLLQQIKYMCVTELLND